MTEIIKHVYLLAVVVQIYNYIVAQPLPHCIQCNYIVALPPTTDNKVNNQQWWAWLFSFLKSSMSNKFLFTFCKPSIINKIVRIESREFIMKEIVISRPLKVFIR
jgi:hypothetical protein